MWHSILKYETETLEEYLETKFRQVSKDKWFSKPKKFSPESEFRVVFYGCEQRGEGPIYMTRDDHNILEVDLTGFVSDNPIKL